MTALDTRNVPAFLTAPERHDWIHEWYVEQLRTLYQRVAYLRQEWEDGP